MGKSAMRVVEYDPEWPQLYEDESERVRRLLDVTVMMTEHFGSTAVPGLAAKPTVDFCVILEDGRTAPDAVDSLEEIGYRIEREWTRRTVLRRSSGAEHAFHLHLGRPETLSELRGNLAFRNYLRDHPAIRERYAQVKRRAAAESRDDIEKYYEAKNPTVEEIMERARDAGYPERVDMSAE